MRHYTTFRQLEIFEAIARLGSFTRASEELYLTQPTVSMQMKKLSEMVGVPLIEQVGKKIYLTEDGQELAQATREIFGIMDRFTTLAAERQGLKKGQLRLMAITTASYFAPRLLGEFAKLYPGIEVSLRVTNKEQVLASIANNLDDLYLLGQPPEGMEIESTLIMDNPIIVLAAPDHPLAKEKNISLERLAQEPWLMREKGSGTRNAIERRFAEQGISVRPRLELGSNEAIKQAILTGLGISALSRHTLTLNQPGQFAVLDVQGYPILRHWYAIYPAGRQMSVAARAFLDYLLERSKQKNS
ncbi:MAG: LysR family transcriptional regulator [Halothiobacillus sp. 14-56-357]|jgi:DNA-binding transcriptional LysR family regulator|uniref:LysR family transcriptional regulator n=1 Tax=Halothiobacillus sp. 15-55-196 TaxID=1970382 RepID=UPI000BCDD0A5|nr:LysR family transcriptional regulator [Halothiobacillus sp. 15-55-196]OZB35677.1 MAG: LysR family transcriptional regulator [Halothiobacillus sp. 15-55-196]OZB57462.1 MAG: LysR family transcriptional regulator [Halothiobacillus sp. 14-56-357]OZB79397.1 MAG: LysR family transcriptional regulator [Halothiobacillus sp. 13-55-115]